MGMDISAYSLREHSYCPIVRGRHTDSLLCRLQFPSSVVNAELHYAVGDAVSWSGIKRVGNAFIMGQFVATNLLMQIHGGAWAVPFKRLGDAVDDNPVGLTKLVDCPPMKPMMALSLGKLALVYRGDDSGEWTEEDQEAVVGRGLGIERKSLWPMRVLVAKLFRLFFVFTSVSDACIYAQESSHYTDRLIFFIFVCYIIC